MKYFIVLTFLVCSQLVVSNTCRAQIFNRIEGIALPGNVSNNSGVAVADYDQDGFLDIFITKNLDTDPLNSNKLLRNTGGGSFVNVTLEAGLINSIGGTGASWGDYDNDGDSDLFLTGVSRNQLYRNNGDGTFTDVTEFAGLDEF